MVQTEAANNRPQVCVNSITYHGHIVNYINSICAGKLFTGF